MASKAKSTFVLLITLITVLGMAAPAFAAATSNDPVTDYLNLGGVDEEETAPHPYINASVTTAQQDLSQGTSDEAIMGYEDDNGDWVAGSDNPFVYNDTHDVDDAAGNDFTFNPAHISDEGLQAFPDGHDADSDWLNDSTNVWELTNSGNVTLSETTVASDVDAIRFDTGTNGDGETDGELIYEASYNGTDHEDGDSELGLDSDESKRVLLVAGDLDTLETNAELQIRVYDETGDYKQIVANDSKTLSDSDVFATATGSFFYQIKLNKLSTNGGGSWDNIENVTVRVVVSGSSNGDADVSISALDLRRKGKLTLGEKRATTNDDGNDPDSDGDYDEFQTIYNATGDISVHSMTTLDSAFDDAVINDLTYPVHYQADGLDEQGEEGEYVIYWEDPDDPQFDDKLNVTYSLELPNEIDLSYSNTEVRMVQKWSDGRYAVLEQASGVADSTNLTESDFSSVSTASKGDEVTIQSSSVDAGERFVVHYELQITSDERANKVEVGGAATPDEADDGGAGGFFSSGGGGILGFLSTPLGMVAGIVGAFLGFRWWQGRG